MKPRILAQFGSWLPPAAASGILALGLGVLDLSVARAAEPGPELRRIRQVMSSPKPPAERRAAIRLEFEAQPLKLAAVIEEIDDEQEGAVELARVAQDGLVDLLSGQDCHALLACIKGARSPKKVGWLAGVLPRSPALIATVRAEPTPLLGLLEAETNSLTAVKAYAETLAQADRREAVPSIRSKLRLDHLNAEIRLALDASLMRLADEVTVQQYVQMLASNDLSRQNRALEVLARSRSPRVIQYLAAWFDRPVYPPVPPQVDPPWRYSDVACRFTEYFKTRESGPLRLTYVPQYSPQQTQALKAFWEEMRNSPDYR